MCAQNGVNNVNRENQGRGYSNKHKHHLSSMNNSMNNGMSNNMKNNRNNMSNKENKNGMNLNKNNSNKSNSLNCGVNDIGMMKKLEFEQNVVGTGDYILKQLMVVLDKY